MLGRMIKIDTDWQTVAAVQDLLEVKLGTAQAGYLVDYKVMQKSVESTSSIPKHATTLKRATGSFTSGSGGGAATVVKGQSGDPAHGLATTERNNTTQAVIGTGTLDDIDPDVFNESAGALERSLIPEAWFPIGPSEAVILCLDEAPASQSLRAIMTLFITHG